MQNTSVRTRKIRRRLTPTEGLQMKHEKWWAWANRHLIQQNLQKRRCHQTVQIIRGHLYTLGNGIFDLGDMLLRSQLFCRPFKKLIRSYWRKAISQKKIRAFLAWPDREVQLLTWRGKIESRGTRKILKNTMIFCCEALSHSVRKRHGGCNPHVRPRMAKRHVRARINPYKSKMQ